MNPFDPDDYPLRPTVRRLSHLWWGERRLVLIGLACALVYTTLTLSVSFLAAVVVGGLATVAGPIFGTLFIVLVGYTALTLAMMAQFGRDEWRSHGETFLNLLEKRLVVEGLYFLDEPEAPLSPLRILSLISLLKQVVADGSQLVICTHSPILMAFPGAEILLFEGDTITPTPYQELDHVRLTRAFLNDPEGYLRRL